MCDLNLLGAPPPPLQISDLRVEYEKESVKRYYENDPLNPQLQQVHPNQMDVKRDQVDRGNRGILQNVKMSQK